MYKPGDDIFIVDNGRWINNKEIVVHKRIFVEYTSSDHSKLVFDGETSLTTMSWTASPTVEDATKFAIVCIIKPELFELKASETELRKVDVDYEYRRIESEDPDLIFKFMDRVVER